ncbi:MAG: cell division protein FtsZ [Thermoplasmata archaeon]|nr:MAG: cell division protein FtsZ [Thermoplasmata archaeon]
MECYNLELENGDLLGVPKIMTIGCGGAGNNSMTRLYELGVETVEIVSINTDWQDLVVSEADKKILIGKNLTRGRGAGGDPKLAERCCESSRNVIEDLFREVNLVFITAGMGGGTGTGISPIIAEIARKQGAIVVAIVTTPFDVERERKHKAREGVKELKNHANCTIVLDNNRLVKLVGSQPLDRAFTIMDQLIAEIIKGVAESITLPSLINLDFSDLKAIMTKKGISTIMYGEGTCQDPEDLIKKTLNNPLLDINFKDALGAMIHITSGEMLSLKAVEEITEGIIRGISPNANVIMGARIDPSLKDRVKVMSIISGAEMVEDLSVNTIKRNVVMDQLHNRSDWGRWDIQSIM